MIQSCEKKIHPLITENKSNKYHPTSSYLEFISVSESFLAERMIRTV